MKAIAVAAMVVVCGSLAAAQSIDVANDHGPSGTHIDHELPISSFDYGANIYTTPAQSFHVLFRVWKNTTLKSSESVDIINPASPYHFVRTVSFSGWGLVEGDTVKYICGVNLLAYPTVRDTDTLYGDVVDEIARVRPSGLGTAGPLLAILEDRRRRLVMEG